MLSNSEGKMFSNPEFCVQQNYHMSVNEEQCQRFTSAPPLLGSSWDCPLMRELINKREAWGCGEQELPQGTCQGPGSLQRKQGGAGAPGTAGQKLPGDAPLTRRR